MLDERELLDQVILLYIAGHETTVNLIGNGTLALLRHRDQLDRLRADPALAQNAVEELLRFDSPVQFSRRIALQDFEVDGRRIEAGSFVLTCLGAREPRPGALGRRPPTSSTSAAPVPRSTSRSAAACTTASAPRSPGSRAAPRSPRSTQRFPDLALTDEPPAWNGRIVLRGLDSLPLTF